MKKLLAQALTGLLIIGVILVGLFFWLSPKNVYKRNAGSASGKLESGHDQSVSGYDTYTFEEASEIFTVDQSLLLVNTEYQIGADYPADIVEYKDTGVLMNRCITDSYAALSSAVMEETGDKLLVMSSYRTYEDQARVLEEEGPDVAAIPGTSEHQTGLALDVYISGFAGAGFIQCDAGQFVNDNCYDYGFIIRYPYGAEDITGFEYEPWHIRYVGLPHSKFIQETGCLFEDYAGLFEIGKYKSYDGYLIGRMPKDDILIPEDADASDVVISEDGLGYVFVTVKTAEK